jgi:CRP-like cAMP-binding protein
VREGEPAEAVFLLVAGRLSVLAPAPDGQLRRLATLTRGASFGEAALVERATRTARVRAEEPSVCWALPREKIEAELAGRPELRAALLGSLLRSSVAIASRLTRELAAARGTLPGAPA